MLHKIDLSKVSFVGEALTQLRNEVKNEAAVLGFIGSPWTLATYLVEGGSSSLYKTIKGMCYSNPQLLDAILSHLAEQQTEYVRFQIDSGEDSFVMCIGFEKSLLDTGCALCMFNYISYIQWLDTRQ